MPRKIITDHKPSGHYTPDFDWRARREGDDDTDPHGFGPTEQDAIDDLLSQEAEERT